MYTPAHFEENRIEVLHRFLRAYPLAAIVTEGLEVTHAPVFLDAAAGLLRCHFARANEHWQSIGSGRDVLVIFTGPEHYVSPAWYPSKQEHGRVVPTWNYTAVHVGGRARVFEDPEALIRHVSELTQANDTAWKVDDAPRSYIEGLARGIVGIEISIERIEGKWKLSQNRPEEDRAGVIEGLEALGSGRSLAVAELMKTHPPRSD